MPRVILINTARTLLVNVFCPEAVADILQEEIAHGSTSLEIAHREYMWYTWGPPVVVHYESTERA